MDPGKPPTRSRSDSDAIRSGASLQADIWDTHTRKVVKVMGDEDKMDRATRRHWTPQVAWEYANAGVQRTYAHTHGHNLNQLWAKPELMGKLNAVNAAYARRASESLGIRVPVQELRQRMSRREWDEHIPFYNSLGAAPPPVPPAPSPLTSVASSRTGSIRTGGEDPDTLPDPED